MASTLNASNAGSGGLISTADASGVLQLQSAGTTAVTIDTSQNVGIGTTSPDGNLHVYKNAASSLIRVTSSTTGVAGVDFGDTDAVDRGQVRYFNNGDYLLLATANTERMRIDSSGKVFIGTTSITVGYSLPGLIIGGSTAPLLKWQSTNGPKSWDAFIDSSGTNLYWAYNGTDKAYINASTGAWTTTSDLRAKKEITDITYGLNAVMELRPVSYLMNEDEDTSKKHLGFIAQEVKTVIDEAVDDVEEGKMYGFDKSGLVPVLVKAIQEQQTIINDLKARVTALEAK